ncbi:hypothetical protein QFZ67_000073 [Streptomyces sp. V1I1]|nr:hypothetical protein [Streptomyces sp. V1I1]
MLHLTGPDPGRIATDLAVMLADRGEAIADLAVLRDQAGVFGPSPRHRRPGGCSPMLTRPPRLACFCPRPGPGSAWLQAAETGSGIPAVKAGGRELPGLVLDLDATLVTCHSEKQ